MAIQNTAGMITEPLRCHSSRDTRCWKCRVDISSDLLDEDSSLIDRVMTFAFDTLGALHLDLRVHQAERQTHTTQQGT